MQKAPITPAPYKQRPKVPKPKEDPPNNAKSSAKAPESSLRENLTLQNWMTVVNYYDDHQPMSQQELVHYFTHRAEGALIFNQSTLSRHLSKKGWDADQHRLKSFPTALSSKRIRTVVCPDVDKWLVLWVKHMEEERKETVNGVMLMAKHKKFENALKVLEKERMLSDGWVSKFYKVYVWIIPLILNRCWSNAHSGMVSKNTNSMVKWISGCWSCGIWEAENIEDCCWVSTRGSSECWWKWPVSLVSYSSNKLDLESWWSELDLKWI